RPPPNTSPSHREPGPPARLRRRPGRPPRSPQPAPGPCLGAPARRRVRRMADTPIRCGWRGMAGDPLYEAYHDTEWGVPEYDSRALWEKLVLDGFQAGLAWITILRKRAAFRAAFDGCDQIR